MAIKRIFSAGGIVIRPKTIGLSRQAEIGSDPEWRVLVTQHSKYKGWDFPKGHLEVGETSEQAALREVEEETGVKAEIIEKVGQTQYFYYEDGSKAFKTVTFFLMKFLEQGVATTAFEVSDQKWLPVDEVEAQLTFKDTKELWKKAKEKIKRLVD